MTPERWQEVNRILDEAMNLGSPEEVATLLDERCADGELRAAVEGMLAACDSNFLEKPAMEVEAEREVERQMQLIGQSIGHFRIESLLGVGGMGEVYKAKDNRLGREVAIKVLPATLSEAHWLVRFEQEAHTASALNHPNIITVHESGQMGSLYYIVTELIDGATLRARMEREGLRLPDILSVTIEITKALSAAHAAGIVHRDIKPENIMLHRDGYIKVLDFGLANFTQQSSEDEAAGELNNSNKSAGLSQPAGTMRYMSPEQLLWEPVDARTDIWSTGVILYEMLAGYVPFDWRLTGNAREKIEMYPLTLPDVEGAPELQQILATALQKDKKARYQRIDELRSALQKLKEKLDNEITEADVQLFVGSNYNYYAEMLRPQKTGWKPKFNFAAFSALPFWLGYRKMYLYLNLFITNNFILGLFLSTFLPDKLPSSISIGMSYGLGMIANGLYRPHVYKKLREIKEQKLPSEQEKAMIKRTGGTSVLGIGLGFLYLFTLFLLPYAAGALRNEVTVPGREAASTNGFIEEEGLALLKEANNLVDETDRLLTTPVASPLYIEQAHDPAEFRAFAQDQKELYERGISLMLKAADNYDKCAKLLTNHGRDTGDLPLRIQLIHKQAEIMESYRSRAQTVSTLKSLTREVMKAERLRMELRMEPLKQEREKLVQKLIR